MGSHWDRAPAPHRPTDSAHPLRPLRVRPLPLIRHRVCTLSAHSNSDPEGRPKGLPLHME
jgi:hypothetical protein